MLELHYLLLTDGGSDRVLQPILEMTIRTIHPALTVTGEFVDHRVLSLRKARSLSDRVAVALESTVSQTFCSYIGTRKTKTLRLVVERYRKLSTRARSLLLGYQWCR
jgi:hypothetical protein